MNKNYKKKFVFSEMKFHCEQMKTVHDLEVLALNRHEFKPERSCCISHTINTSAKGMYPTILTPAFDK